MNIKIWDLRSAEWVRQPPAKGRYGVGLQPVENGTVFRLGDTWQIIVPLEKATAPPWDEILCRRDEMRREWLIPHIRLFWREGMGSLEVFLRELNGTDEPDLRNFLVRLHEEMPRQGAEKAGRIAFLEVEG